MALKYDDELQPMWVKPLFAVIIFVVGILFLSEGLTTPTSGESAAGVLTAFGMIMILASVIIFLWFNSEVKSGVYKRRRR
jgi:hypothetical protein